MAYGHGTWAHDASRRACPKYCTLRGGFQQKHSTAQAQKIKGKGKATAQHNRGKAEPSRAGTRRARWGAPEGAGGGVVARGPGSFFLDDCSRAEQLSLAAMAQAPMPGVQGSAEQATVLSTVSRDAEKLALLEELKESIQRMERANAPTFVGTSPRNLDVFVFGNPMRLEDNAVAQRLAHL